MCLIIDANVAGLLCQSDLCDDAKPVVDWIERRGGRIVYGGKLAKELAHGDKRRRWLRTLSQAGRVVRVSDELVDAEAGRLERIGCCASDDPHIVALARVSGCRVLYSNDQELHADFRDADLISGPRGSVYQTRHHIHLLRRSDCGTS